MEQIDDISLGCRRLIELLEDERTTISECLGGEIRNSYQALLTKEVEQLKGWLSGLNKLHY